MFLTDDGTKSHRRQNTQEVFAVFTRAFPDSFDVSEMEKKKTLALGA